MFRERFTLHSEKRTRFIPFSGIAFAIISLDDVLLDLAEKFPEIKNKVKAAIPKKIKLVSDFYSNTLHRVQADFHKFLNRKIQS